ncbi:hypothetical protein QE152_g13188 [Popillia japonica]|uniref:Uncharacterized protein n=1 Tax=Popillia japonica TaxID=7064 RepID=A0AAW1LFA7_POPJA
MVENHLHAPLAKVDYDDADKVTTLQAPIIYLQVCISTTFLNPQARAAVSALTGRHTYTQNFWRTVSTGRAAHPPPDSKAPDSRAPAPRQQGTR